MGDTERMKTMAGENLKKIVETPVEIGFVNPRGLGEINGETTDERSRRRLAAAGDPPDIEALAAAEHESWAKWTNYMLEQIHKEFAEAVPGCDHDRELWNLPCVNRWSRQVQAHYDALSEKEKESDRVEARKKLRVYRPWNTGTVVLPDVEDAADQPLT